MNKFQTIFSQYIFFSQTEYFLQVQEFYSRQRIILAYLFSMIFLLLASMLLAELLRKIDILTRF